MAVSPGCSRKRMRNVWVRDNVQSLEEEGLLCFIKSRKLDKYDYWKRVPDNLVLTSTDEKLPGKTKAVEENEIERQHEALSRWWT